MYLVKTPAILKPLAGNMLWHVKTTEKKVFLTFDDGPTPDVTEQTLGLLDSFGAKATFFCLGKNALNHPEIFAKIQEYGHGIGNHSFSHPDGWRTSNYAYLRDVLHASEHINSRLFRPPYGRITRGQSIRLSKRFRLVMWDIISGDFDNSRSADQCADAVIRNYSPGSIVVFHDSEKAKERMIPALRQTLEALSSDGYTFCALEQPEKPDDEQTDIAIKTGV